MKVISLNPDLQKLQNEGYELEIKGGYLIIHHIPYVTSSKTVAYGKLVSNLNIAGDKLLKPDTHVVKFVGQFPCDKNGLPLPGLAVANSKPNLLAVEHLFSNVPNVWYYKDYHEKMTRYIKIITAHVKDIDPNATAQTYKPIVYHEDLNFCYMDTNSSRANIQAIHAKIQQQKIGIVGLGGTGSYILDLIAKMPLASIVLFDGDTFLQHNAFRAPGAPSLETLSQQPKKVDYFYSIYSKMNRQIQVHADYISKDNIQLLDNLNYVFIAIDNGAAKTLIMKRLLERKIPFCDVGIGVSVSNKQLRGQVRVTSATDTKFDHLSHRVSTDEPDRIENEYSTNIQISDLNMLNAALAVIKWKKGVGIYQDSVHEHNTAYIIERNDLRNDDLK